MDVESGDVRVSKGDLIKMYLSVYSENLTLRERLADFDVAKYQSAAKEAEIKQLKAALAIANRQASTLQSANQNLTATNAKLSKDSAKSLNDCSTLIKISEQLRSELKACTAAPPPPPPPPQPKPWSARSFGQQQLQELLTYLDSANVTWTISPEGTLVLKEGLRFGDVTGGRTAVVHDNVPTGHISLPMPHPAPALPVETIPLPPGDPK